VKQLVACLILIGLTLPAAAVEGGQVKYVGGTVPAVTAGLVGRLETTSEASLAFEYGTDKLVIPYAAIESYEYSTEVAHHLGVLPAIAVGLFKKRKRRHFFRISFGDAGHTSQVAVFEVSKHMPLTLKAVLQTRAPRACRPHFPYPGRE